MKDYLVLGGNGFIGKNIVKKLSSDNRVVVADRVFDDIYDSNNVSFKEIDYVSCQDFSPYLEKIDTVIHLVSTIGPSDNLSNIERELSDNVFPTVRLLDSMVKSKTDKIVFVSSGGTVYGEHSLTPIKEDEVKNPICHYGLVKALIEQYIQLYNLYYNIDYRIVRLANPYSDVTKLGRSQGIIPIFTDQLLNNDEINIWGNGNDVRDYIYIEDAVDAIMKIINYSGSEKIFNVGTGKGYSVNDILNTICHELGVSKPNVSYHDERKCDVKNNVLDIERLSSCVGWQPSVSLEDGVKHIVKKKVREVNDGKKNW